MDRKEEIIEEIKKLKQELKKIDSEEISKEEKKKFKDIKMSVISNNIFIVYGGLGEPNPKGFMDDIVETIIKKIGSPYYAQLVDIFLDNPYYRLVIINPDDIEFEDSLSDVITKLKKE